MFFRYKMTRMTSQAILQQCVVDDTQGAGFLDLCFSVILRGWVLRGSKVAPSVGWLNHHKRANLFYFSAKSKDFSICCAQNYYKTNVVYK